MDQWMMYFGALIAVFLLPGADMVLVMNTAASRGLRSGIWTAGGLALSRSLHVALSGLGLAALFALFPALFEVVRVAGALFLLWMAWKVISANSAASPEQTTQTPLRTGFACFRQGLLTNLLNPKAFMFCSIFLPQFITHDRPLLLQYLQLGIGLVATGFVFDLIYSALASFAARRLARQRKAGKVMKVMFGGVFTLTAVKLLLG